MTVLHRTEIRASAEDRFLVRDAIVDADGSEHVRFDRRYRGLPVIGGDVVVHSRRGRFQSASLTLDRALRLGTVPSLKAGEAIAIADAEFDGRHSEAPSANLVVYARGPDAKLAYEVVLSGEQEDRSPVEAHYIVDASSGEILDLWDGIETVATGGSGNSQHNGLVAIDTNFSVDNSYSMRDLTRGGGYTVDAHNLSVGYQGTVLTDADNVWGDSTDADRNTAGVDAHYGATMTWDYYQTIHQRTGIAGNGKGAMSRVHVGQDYVNAYWSDSCFCMSYGDGDGVNYAALTSLDIAAHEMSHGVMSATADLTYSGESGGLNEANSDIFGTMVEYFSDNDAYDSPDYLIGEKIYLNNPSGTKALRYMFKPSLDGASPDCYFRGIGRLDVHYSSGVGNHFFYLLAEGASVPQGFGSLKPSDLVCNGDTSLAGVGRAKAEQIWYRALTVYMTSNTRYADARTATLKATADLYGRYSAEYRAVAAAWSAVGVG
jgi:Zn-dependent metalloprotease